MQTSPFHRTASDHVFSRNNLSSIAALAAAIGFLLSLLLALLMLQGSPAMLALWLGAALATLAFMRVHRKWRAMFERIYVGQLYAAHPAQSVLVARKDWRRNVEDVVFRETGA